MNNLLYNSPKQVLRFLGFRNPWNPENLEHHGKPGNSFYKSLMIYPLRMFPKCQNLSGWHMSLFHLYFYFYPILCPSLPEHLPVHRAPPCTLGYFTFLHVHSYRHEIFSHDIFFIYSFYSFYSYERTRSRILAPQCLFITEV